ncbi:MAG TPA: acyl-CoA dehydratase activase [bacterium]|nr:acyl-CoA dehydratase activase [bacterium]
MKNFGIDIGSTFLTIHSLQSGGTVLRRRHGGKIFENIASFINECDDHCRFSFTGKGAKEFAEMTGIEPVEESIAVLRAAEKNKLLGDGFLRIVDIGGSSLTLYSFKDGKIADIAKNALCAAGTGLFLEEQAERLALDIETAGEMHIDNPPLVASRCTVFAKSDLIHHQQEGRSRQDMWAGLCKSLVVSAMNTLFRGEELYGRIVLIGGVSLNAEVVKWMKKLYPRVEWVIPKHAEAFIAMGAAQITGTPKDAVDLTKKGLDRFVKKMPALTLHKSNYPKLTNPEVDPDGNEIRRHRPLDGVKSLALGLDIGSTSTKLVVLDAANKEPLFDLYRKTGGDPVGATRKVFGAFYRLMGDRAIEVAAFGTTGSGRKLVGEIFGADTIVNEITAHGTGAAMFYPDAETIFEIGGQDAKYLRLEDGLVADVNMNYVCAAGTGSFVEEQARKLGYPLDKIGPATENIAPPVTSDRCTVFMEQDLRAILKQGYSKQEALAAVLYSVIQNYLMKVVGNRPISRKKVHFQGATARNKGLVAAFENLLGVEVVVSPFCHVMGSIGAAQIALEKTEGTASRFIGPQAATVEVTTGTSVCKLCTNYCRINTITRTDGGSFSWGFMCGRDPSEEKRRELPQYESFKTRNALYYKKDEVPQPPKGTVHIPHTLVNHTYYPLWRKFFALLGYETQLSALYSTPAIREEAAHLATGDFCYPAKVAIGHAVSLFKKNALVFHPYYISDKQQVSTAFAFFCPYVESSPAVIRSFVERGGRSDIRFLTPVIDLRLDTAKVAKMIHEAIGHEIPVKKKEIEKAFAEAYATWEKTYGNIRAEGERIVAERKKEDKPVFVIIGRPYNIHDRGINLGIAEAIAAMGHDVVPIDMLDLDIPSLAAGNHFNVFWNYGQKIVAAAKRIRATKNMFAIYLSNFNCGPDSFLLSYVEEEMKGKPMLILELDEHDSDGGYRTRVEAFMDVVKSFRKKGGLKRTGKPTMPDVFTADRSIDLKSGTIWIPPMHESGPRMFAAAFRSGGYEARALDPEDEEALLLGKRTTRGCECLPMTLTLGAILKKAGRERDKKHIVFMPTAEGPCRFGQYNLLERKVFWNEGYDNIDILAPSSINSYQGVDENVRRALMHGTMAGDLLLKLTTKIRPYETTKGDTDELFEKSLTLLENELAAGRDLRRVFPGIVDDFAKIPRSHEQRPLVGVVGEIYVRSNRFANGDLIRVIEQNGGEAWLSPIHEWISYTMYMQSFMAKQQGVSLFGQGESLVKNLYFGQIEKSYYRAAHRLLSDRHEPPMKEVMEEGMKYLPVDFSGEAIITVGRTILFARQGAKMVVNAAPFGCMPGTITGSIFLELKDALGIPIVSQFYDGDLDINDKVSAILKTIVSNEALEPESDEMLSADVEG